MDRKLTGLIVFAGALLLVGGWWLARDRGEQQRASERGSPQTERSSTTAQPSTHDEALARARSSAPEREREASFDRAKRDVLRTEILQALAERPSRTAVRVSEDEPPPEPGQLSDRIGGREALLRQLNHDFMPLADECIEQARARRPELAGMIAIGLETVADEELGGIVESVTTQPQNEVDDAELLECLSQTALSMILPPPPESGREQFMLTIPIEAQDE